MPNWLLRFLGLNDLSDVPVATPADSEMPIGMEAFIPDAIVAEMLTFGTPEKVPSPY